MHKHDFYRLLVQRYIGNKATEEELQVFFQLLKEGKLDEYLTDAMNAATFAAELVAEEVTIGKRKIVWPVRIAVAAAVLLLFSVSTYLVIGQGKQQPQVAHIQKQTNKIADSHIAPGSDKAVLILGDGAQITLDNEQNGILSQQGNTKIIKQNQQLVYDASAKKSGSIAYNTIVTPPGGQYQITLSDDTKVWLNAASSLRFPTTFTGQERRVELTGEAYFEVSHNAKQPFIVQKGASEVKVLGTHFNINAYEDEPNLKVTLLQGSVQVHNSGKTALLQPGQQAKILTNAAIPIQVQKDADIEQVIAWKKGIFQFEGADIQEVMRQISRWYNVAVVYEGTVGQHFSGTISKYVEASKVLQMLELTGAVHFKIDDKKIIVRP